MPTSATGHCKPARQASRTAGRGFTLLELLAGISIVAILLGSIRLALPADAGATHHAAVRAWQAQADWAQTLALQRGTPCQWEIRGRTARLLEKTPDGWVVPDMPVAAPRTLPPGLNPVPGPGHTVSGAGGPVMQVLFYPGQGALFELRIESPAQAWLIRGNPAGRVQLLEAQAEGG